MELKFKIDDNLINEAARETLDQKGDYYYTAEEAEAFADGFRACYRKLLEQYARI